MILVWTNDYSSTCLFRNKCSFFPGGPQQHANGGKKLSRRFSKEASPHLPSQGAQTKARNMNGNGDMSNAEFMQTPSAGFAG